MDGKSNRKYNDPFYFWCIILSALFRSGDVSDCDICFRTVPLTTQASLSQINKRRLEFGVDVETFRSNDRRLERMSSDGSMDEEEIHGKRRRRLLDDERRDEPEFRRRPLPMHRPQTLRQPEEDDETLIRETQAALRTLSGNWNREPPQPPSADENDDANGFENLFDDKRSEKMPSSPSQSSDMSQKSFSTHHQAQHMNGNNSDRENKTNLITIEIEKCEDYDRLSRQSTQYGAPNFDELVDSSSNELEIDMSDRCDDKYNDDRDIKPKRKGEMVSVNKQSLYNAYKAATAALPYSTQSAFKPPAEVKHRLHNPSLPSEPFGGYSNEHDRKENKGSKQYTVLQPAGAGSRAATALQEARTVPLAQPARDSRPLNALSPPARGTAHPHSQTTIPQTFLTTWP